jgi:hypothetical protein
LLALIVPELLEYVPELANALICWFDWLAADSERVSPLLALAVVPEMLVRLSVGLPCEWLLAAYVVAADKCIVLPDMPAKRPPCALMLMLRASNVFELLWPVVFAPVA